MSPNGAQPSIMIVDDEEMVIASIKAFLQLETDYAVHASPTRKRPRASPKANRWTWPSPITSCPR